MILTFEFFITERVRKGFIWEMLPFSQLLCVSLNIFDWIPKEFRSIPWVVTMLCSLRCGNTVTSLQWSPTGQQTSSQMIRQVVNKPTVYPDDINLFIWRLNWKGAHLNMHIIIHCMGKHCEHNCGRNSEQVEPVITVNCNGWVQLVWIIILPLFSVLNKFE